MLVLVSIGIETLVDNDILIASLRYLIRVYLCVVTRQIYFDLF